MTRQNSKTTPLKAQPTMRASKATVDTTIATQPSKLDILLDILRRKDGASIAELAAATDWQAHSVRGALAGTLKKKGHTILSEKIEGVRRYRIGASA